VTSRLETHYGQTYNVASPVLREVCFNHTVKIINTYKMECASFISSSDWEEETETVAALIVVQEDINESSWTRVHIINKN